MRMVNEILTAAGVQFRRSRFPRPPKGTYAVYMEDVSTDGSDGAEALVLTHDVIVELYEPAPDDEAEAAIETAITAAGLPWTKQDRYWIDSEQLYQVVYDFTYYDKRRA